MNYTKIYDRNDIESSFKEIIEVISKKNSKYNTARLSQNNVLVSRNIFSSWLGLFKIIAIVKIKINEVKLNIIFIITLDILRVFWIT